MPENKKINIWDLFEKAIPWAIALSIGAGAYKVSSCNSIDYLNQLGDFFVKYGGWGAAIVLGLYVLMQDREFKKHRIYVSDRFEQYHKELVTIHTEDARVDNRLANRIAGTNRAFNDLISFLRNLGIKIELENKEESVTIILDNNNEE